MRRNPFQSLQNLYQPRNVNSIQSDDVLVLKEKIIELEAIIEEKDQLIEEYLGSGFKITLFPWLYRIGYMILGTRMGSILIWPMFYSMIFISLKPLCRHYQRIRRNL